MKHFTIKMKTQGEKRSSWTVETISCIKLHYQHHEHIPGQQRTWSYSVSEVRVTWWESNNYYVCSSDDQAQAEVWAFSLFSKKACNTDRLGAKATGRTYSVFTLTSPYVSCLELLKIFLKYMESISHWSSYSLLPINHSKVGTSELHRVCQASHQHSEGRLQGKKCTHIVRLVVHAIYLHIF